MLRPAAASCIAVLGILVLIPAAYTQAQYEETTAYVDWQAGPNALTKRIEYVVSGPADGDAILFIHGTFFADSFLPVMQEEALGQYRKILSQV